MKKVILIALVCVIVVAALAGCGGSGGSKPEDAVVGKWDLVDEGMSGLVLSLEKDGTYSFTDKDGNSDDWATGKYEVIEDKVTLYDENGKKTDEFLIDGKEMKNPNDGSVIYSKQ